MCPVEITFQGANTSEMIPWLMTWGSTVEVLEPDWLRKEVAANARIIVEIYEGD